MLDLIFKPYINYKIKDIINAEIQSSINENYKYGNTKRKM